MCRLVLLMVVLFLLWPDSPQAQIRFESPSLTQLAGGAPTLSFRARLSVGDLNHDGIPDVVAPSQLGAVVLLGRGDGTLSLPITAGGSARFSAIADFDGDGHPDIGWGGGVNYGDGSGENWDVVQLLPAPGGGVVAADFDGDGGMDFALHVFPDTIRTLLSRSNRTFQSIVGVAGMSHGNSTKAMRVCDLNRDGRPDVALCLDLGYDIDFIALVGVGDGTFQYRPHPVSSPEPQGLGSATSRATAFPTSSSPTTSRSHCSRDLATARSPPGRSQHSTRCRSATSSSATSPATGCWTL